MPRRRPTLPSRGKAGSLSSLTLLVLPLVLICVLIVVTQAFVPSQCLPSPLPLLARRTVTATTTSSAICPLFGSLSPSPTPSSYSSSSSFSSSPSSRTNERRRHSLSSCSLSPTQCTRLTATVTGDDDSGSGSSSSSGSSNKKGLRSANSNNNQRRPQVFIKKLQAIVGRFRMFIRSKLMLKVNGRPILKITGWHASFAMVLAFVLLSSVFGGAAGGGAKKAPVEIPYSDFMKLVKDHGPEVVSRLRIAPDRFDFLVNGVSSFTRPVKAHPALLFFLDKYNIPFYAGAASSKSLVVFLMLNLLPFAWIFLSMGMGRRMYGDMTGTVGKDAEGSNIDRSLTFDDVAGIDRAKREVQELVDMLKSPQKYGKLGARLPKGILLAGPPGTGKTLLARALASEAGVPFIYSAGSEFVEMFVGRGAARIRALFQRARKQAPCIIFLDELDTLGKQRSLRLGGSNDEVEQTLNQLLACMDGLDSNKSGVIVIAATNRYEILDDALTRPGRLDRIVRVELPDRSGREDILRVHTRKTPLGSDVDLAKTAQLTPGMSGADLAGLVNEAAIRAVRRSSSMVTQVDFDLAVKDFFRSRGTEAEKSWKRLVGNVMG